MAAGSSLLILLTPATPYGQVLLALLLLGAGDIAVITPVADVILSAVPRERTGSAAALNGAAIQIGGALGTAVLTSVLMAVGRAAYYQSLEPSGLSRQDIAAATETLRQSIQKGAASGGLAIPEMVRTQLADAYRHAFSVGAGGVFACSALICLLAAVFVWFGLKKKKWVERFHRPLIKLRLSRPKLFSVKGGRQNFFGNAWMCSSEMAETRRKRKAHSDASALPEFVEPMKAKLVESLSSGDWIYEIKFDGYRALALRGGSDTRVLSRNEKDLGRMFSEVRDSVSALDVQDVIIDGEIVALDEKGRSSFQLLQAFEMGQEKPPVVFYAFDILQLDGKDLRNLPVEERKAKLEELLSRTKPLMPLGKPPSDRM